MKRLLSILALAVFLTIPLAFPAQAVFSEASTPPFTVWDIPWGVTIEQFQETVSHKTGIEFENRSNIYCRPVEDQTILLCGLSVDKISAHFAENGSYNELVIDIGYLPPFASADAAMISWVNVIHRFIQKYGMPTLDFFAPDHADLTRLPWYNDRIDTRAYSKLLQIQNNVDSTVVFRNITVESIIYQGDEDHLWYLLVHIQAKNSSHSYLSFPGYSFPGFEEYWSSLPSSYKEVSPVSPSPTTPQDIIYLDI